LRRMLRTVGRHIANGLSAMGQMLFTTLLPEAAAEGGAPLPGHPERLVPHLPPSPVERQLWAQFGGGSSRR